MVEHVQFFRVEAIDAVVQQVSLVVSAKLQQVRISQSISTHFKLNIQVQHHRQLAAVVIHVRMVPPVMLIQPVVSFVCVEQVLQELDVK